MREVKGNLFDYPADAICITTNPIVNAKGLAVMGAGVALEAARRYPWIRKALAVRLQARPWANALFVFDPLDYEESPTFWPVGEDEPPPKVVAFPVKHHWREPADYGLIRSSAYKLVTITDAMGWETVALPRPGCGNGGLPWPDVRRLIDPLLDDRFVIVDLAG